MNAMGYYIVFWGFQVHSDKQLTHQLDNDSYDHANAIAIKVPVSIPYMMDQLDFSRTDGKFFNDGKYYRMVKQKYANDTLTIVCIRDTNSEQIQTALGDYVKTFADNTQQSSQQNSKLSFSFIKDFMGHAAAPIIGIEGWIQVVTCNIHQTCRYTTPTQSITHPPEHS